MSSGVRSFLIHCVSCLAFCGVVYAQQPQQSQQQTQQQQKQQQQQPAPPVFRSAVNAVRVDVIVTDRDGAPVENLTAADFEVAEDGKPQKVDSARLVRVQTKQEPGGEAPREIHSFDDEATELARDDVRIIVMLLDDYHTSRVGSMNLREWLHRFIDTQVGPYDLVALMYPMTPTAGLIFTRDKFALTAAIDRFEGRRGDYMPRNDAEANYSMESPWRIEQIRSEVVASAIKSVATHLGTLNEGRKSLIVVSESLALASNDQRELIEAANRANVAIYPLDPLGGFGALGGSLRDVADETNGRAITGRRDLDAALAGVLLDSSAYYLLGYNSEKGPDGKFHDITVRVKKPGLQVRARKGYRAPTAEEAARAMEPPKPAPPAAVTDSLSALAEPRSRAIRTWVGMSLGESGKTRVTFVWQAARDTTPRNRPARVVLTATDAKGSTCFKGDVGPEVRPNAGPLGNVLATPGSGPQAWRVDFDAPPGKLQIKLSVEDATSEVIETGGRELNVPDLAAAPVMLTTPEVFRARTWRELQSFAASRDAVPTPARQFSRTDRLLIRFAVRAAGSAPPAIDARLLNSGGSQMAALNAGETGQDPAGRTIDLPLSALPVGDYIIEIVARGEKGEAKELVAIRITG